MPSRKGKLHRQTGWNTTVAAQMTAREGRKKKSESRSARGGGEDDYHYYYFIHRGEKTCLEN